MEGGPSRPVVHPRQKGLPLDLVRQPSISQGTKIAITETRDTSSGSDTPRPGGHLRSSLPTLLSVEDLRSPQRPSRVKVDTGCLGSEQVSQGSYVQDVEPLVPEQAPAHTSLDGKSRSEGCLPTCPNQKQSSQVSGSDMLGKAILFSGPSIRPGDSPLAVHNLSGVSSRQTQKQGVQHLSVHRRSGSLEQEQGRAAGPSPGDYLSPEEFGTHNQREEVKSFALLISNLGRGDMGFPQRHVVSKAKEPRRDSSLSHSSPRLRKGLKETMGKTLRNHCLCGPGKQKSQALQSFNLTLSPLRPRPRPRQGSEVPSSSAERSRPLDKAGHLDDPRALYHAPKILPVLDRRVQSRVGDLGRPRPFLERPLVSKTKQLAHQRTGTPYNLICDKTPVSGRSNPGGLVRQPDRHKCHPEAGLSLSRPAEVGRRPPRGLRGQEAGHPAQTHQGFLECGSRRSLKRGSDTGRMGIEGRNLPELSTPTRQTASSGSLRLSAQSQTPGLLLPIPVSPSLGPGCSCPRLEHLQPGADLSSSGPREGGSQETSQFQGGGSTDPSGQPGSPPALPVATTDQGAIPGSSTAGARRENHPGIRGVRSLSRMEFLRAIYLLDYDEEVVSNLLSHLADSSLRQYQSAWKRFQAWLPDEAEDIDIPLVAKFLVHCHQTCSPRTVLTIRAALILPLNEGFGIDFEHKHFRMLAKAAFRKKPPAQKIVPLWSLDDALKALARKRIKASDKLGRFRKALFLVACATSNRSAELAAIDRSRAEIRQHSAVLPVRPGFIFKNQAQFHAPSLMDIPDLPGSPLCPVKALREYLADTAGSQEQGLFLHPKSGRTLNAGRLAYFLALTISWLIPDALGKAHDTRKLSTSKAFCSGITTEQLLAAGSWRSTGTFAKKYFVPVLPKAKGSVVVARSRC